MLMPTKLRKTRKMRGHTTHGYGSKKKHRGRGSKGGSHYAGSHKHHYVKIMKFEPEHFGKHGFASLKKKGKTVNVGELEKLTSESEIDLAKLGYAKLLGKGRVGKPLTVKVANFSRHAKEKIEKAGGKIVSP